MTNPKQTYTRKANARRAALADLGKGSIEGRDFIIIKLKDGRFAYRTISRPTKGDKAKAAARVCNGHDIA